MSATPPIGDRATSLRSHRALKCPTSSCRLEAESLRRLPLLLVAAALVTNGFAGIVTAEEVEDPFGQICASAQDDVRCDTVAVSGRGTADSRVLAASIAGESEVSVIGIGGGIWHTCALHDDGTTHCWGWNRFGESEDYHGGDAVGVSAGSDHTCILLEHGDVECLGINGRGQSADYEKGNASAITTGASHSCALLEDGNIHCWGDDDFGQSADYHRGDAVDVTAGGDHTCALRKDASVHCWGTNHTGEASDHDKGTAVGIAAGGSHTCALLADGTVDCWGDNGTGQAADYRGGDATAITAGFDHTCVLQSDGRVECWGNNKDGQSADYQGADALAVRIGGHHTCALLENGTVHCWGDNDYGQSRDYRPAAAEGGILAISGSGRTTCSGGGGITEVLGYPDRCSSVSGTGNSSAATLAASASGDAAGCIAFSGIGRANASCAPLSPFYYPFEVSGCEAVHKVTGSDIACQELDPEPLLP